MQQQIGLFDVPAPYQRASRTSKAAAKAIQPKAPTKRAIVLAFVKGRSIRGATNNEIAESNGMKLQTVCPRVNELAKKDTYCVIQVELEMVLLYGLLSKKFVRTGPLIPEPQRDERYSKKVSPDWLVTSQIAKARPDPSNVSRKQTEIKQGDKGFSDKDGR